MSYRVRFGNVISVLIVLVLLVLVVQSFAFRQAETQTILLGVVAGLMAVIVVQSIGWSSHSAVQYKVVDVTSIDDERLQQLGKEGWRLTCLALDLSGCQRIGPRDWSWRGGSSGPEISAARSSGWRRPRDGRPMNPTF